jgi:hypothetical protein
MDNFSLQSSFDISQLNKTLILQASEESILRLLNNPLSNFKWIHRLKATDLTLENYKHHIIDQKEPICIESLTKGTNNPAFFYFKIGAVFFS